jgi:hypothetical protein
MLPLRTATFAGISDVRAEIAPRFRVAVAGVRRAALELWHWH